MRRVLRLLAFVALTALASFAGAVLAGRVQAEVGPFRGTLALRPSLTGDTVVKLAPLGTLTLDTHDGPLGVAVSADELDPVAARRLVEEPELLDELDDGAAADARAALRTAVVRGVLGAVAGALVVTALRRVTKRRLAGAVVVAGLTSASLGGVALGTRSDTALAQPTFTGLLAAAPQAIGSVERVREQYERYRSQLSSLVGNVALLYNTTASLTSYAPSGDTVRLLHVSDLHLNPQAFDVIEQLVQQFRVDVVVDTGDINDWGTALEARFVERIGTLGVPYVYVRGNHDSAATQEAVAAQPNAVVLDGEVKEVAGLRMWGIGDPRFTPDKTEEVGIDEEREIADRAAPGVARRVRRAGPVDVVAVHDPRLAARLGGLTRLVLAGHLHRPSQRRLGAGTTLLVEGSTGGAGLRALQQGEPVDLQCSVLYLDADDRRLRAYDRIAVGGLGRSEVRIERHVVARPPRSGDRA